MRLKTSVCARGHTRSGECRVCARLRNAAWFRAKGYAKRQALLNSLKSDPCMDCGQRYPPYVMDFDHRDPATKVRAVSLMRAAAVETLLKEVEKCDLVCANCHRIRTHGRSVGQAA